MDGPRPSQNGHENRNEENDKKGLVLGDIRRIGKKLGVIRRNWETSGEIGKRKL